MDAIMISDILIKLFNDNDWIPDGYDIYLNAGNENEADNRILIIDMPTSNINYYGKQFQQKKQVKIEIRGTRTGDSILNTQQLSLQVQSYFHGKTYKVDYDGGTYQIIDTVVPNQPGSPIFDANDRLTFVVFVELLVRKI